MPGPLLKEIIGRNINPQAIKKFYAWLMPKGNYRREHLTPGHEEILCLEHALEKLICVIKW